MKNVFINMFLLIGMIILGSAFGLLQSSVSLHSSLTDYLILALVTLVFYDTSLAGITSAVKSPKILLIAWLSNFLILPLLGFALTQLFLPNSPLIALGAAIYFMSPCTDWFLGFTRIAKGNTSLGSVLLPINMVTQLLLFPIWLGLFGQSQVESISIADIADTLLNWCIVPIIIATGLKLVTHLLPKLSGVFSSITNPVLYAVTFCIFAVNINEITKHVDMFMIVLGVVLVFFVISLAITEGISQYAHLNHADHVLYSMTTSARNAPLMLGLTMAALPNQPIIYATIVIGMLIEFPYLAFHVWRFTRKVTNTVQINQTANA